MAANLQNASEDTFAPQFREQCVSTLGQQLAEIIDRNEHVMIQASLLGRPALAPILSILPDTLIEELANDQLMQAFGHMARLEMEFLGFRQANDTDQKITYWPFDDRKSHLAIFSTREI